MTSPTSSQVLPQGDAAIALTQQLGELELQIHQIEASLQQQGIAIGTLQARIPNSAVISPKFLNRAFAIWGHAFVAGIVLAIVVYGGAFLIALLFGGLGALLTQ